MSIIHVVFLIILFIGLILSKVWKINVISPLMFIALIRIYFSLFQKNKILESSEDPLTMFFNMICWLLGLVIHIIFMGKVILRQYSVLFYILNGIVTNFLMLDKVVGFKESWDRRNKLYLNFFLTIFSLLWFGYLIR